MSQSFSFYNLQNANMILRCGGISYAVTEGTRIHFVARTYTNATEANSNMQTSLNVYQTGLIRTSIASE